jgi:hypothetical protein
MPAYNRSRNVLAIPDGITQAVDKGGPSPVTPAVTGIAYPSTSAMDAATETESTRYRPPPNRFYNHPNIAASSIDDVPESVVDGQSLDKLWGSIRQQKERKMAKERPKVQSLEEVLNEAPSSGVDVPVLESQASGRKSLQKQKSMYVLVESLQCIDSHSHFQLVISRIDRWPIDSCQFRLARCSKTEHPCQLSKNSACDYVGGSGAL